MQDAYDELERRVRVLEEQLARATARAAGGEAGAGRSRTPRLRGRSLHAVASSAVLALFVAPFAVAGSGDGGQGGAAVAAEGGTRADAAQARSRGALRIGVRNRSSRETGLISSGDGYALRLSNVRRGEGGGAVFGCRAGRGSDESCVRAENLSSGSAFHFATRQGSSAGHLQVDGPNAVPFTTNARGMVQNLNAEMVGGLTAEQILARAGGSQGGSSAPSGPAGGDLAGSYPSPSIRDGAVTSADIGDGAVGAGDIAENAVGVFQLDIGSVFDTTELAQGASGVEIASGGVGADEIATNGVGAAEIATGAVGADEIATGGVDADEIATAAVRTLELADDAITSAKIVNGTVLSEDIGNGQVLAADIQTAAVGADEIATDAVRGAEIDTDSLWIGDLTRGGPGGTYNTSVPAQSCLEHQASASGAAPGDWTLMSIEAAAAGIVVFPLEVNTANQIRFRVCNVTAGALNAGVSWSARFITG